MVDNLREGQESKNIEIGRIPKEWVVAKLGDESIAKIRGNKSITGFERIAFIPMEFIPDSGVLAKYEILPMKEVKSFTYCERGDLLLAKITPSLENGKQGIVPDNIPNGFALATTEVFPISCKGIDRLFLFYVLKFPKFRNKIISSMIGTTGRQRASKESIENLLIPLPPLPEQQKIAEILSTVDQAIEKVSEAIEKTQRLEKGLMQELLTKGIGHKEFKDTDVGRIPKKWEVVKLAKIVTYEKGRKPKVLLDQREENTFPYLSAETLRTGNFTQWARKIGEVIKVERDEVILIWDGFYCGDSFIGFEGILSSTMIKIEPKNQNLDKHFLFYFLKACFKELNTKISGMYLKHVNKFIFESQKLPLPLLPEQQKIAEILGAVDKRLELIRKRKERLGKIRKGLMNDLLTGRKRVKLN
jgi:type I restriction enzyme S subunit